MESTDNADSQQKKQKVRENGTEDESNDAADAGMSIAMVDGDIDCAPHQRSE